MKIYTMGFTQKSAEEFFNKIMSSNIDILVDVRLNNQSQLAGFTKGRDLEFFLRAVSKCDYKHMLDYAPTKDILDDYKKKKITWGEYDRKYHELISKRKVEDSFKKYFSEYENVLLLCSEPTPECCHRRLLAEYLGEKLNIEVVHI